MCYSFETVTIGWFTSWDNLGCWPSILGAQIWSLILDGSDNCPLVANLSQGDADNDLIGDACDDNDFHRADPNSDGRTNLADAVFELNFLFRGGPAPTCMNAADANNDGRVDLSDAIWTVNYLFLGGLPPPSPGPAANPCGPDTEPLGQPGNIGCALYADC